MRLRGLVAPLAIAVAAAGLAGSALRRPGLPPAQAAAPRPGGGPVVALLVTRPGATFTSLYLPHAGDASPGAPVATFDHIAGAAVRGAVQPGTDTVLAVADTAPGRGSSFAASLFRVTPHRPPEILAGRLVHASRPLITASGRVFVSRGTPGLETPGKARDDDLSVDEIDPATGSARPVLTSRGQLLLLAGALDEEIFVYRVGPTGVDLAAVSLDGGAARVVIPELPPYARDFSVDPDQEAIVFEERDPVDTRAYAIERVDLATGARRRVYTGTTLRLAPFAWPGGGVAYNHEGREGLSLLGAARPLSAGPLGPGVDLVQATSDDRTWVAGLHTVAGRLPLPFAIDTRTGSAIPVPCPSDARAYVAGFLGATSPGGGGR